MPKRLRKPLPSARTAPPVQQPLPEVEPATPTETPTTSAPKRKPGRPSNAEKAAREAAVKAEAALSPAQVRPITLILLQGLAVAVKGDAATDAEIDLVNESATLVANKYNLALAPELALAVSLAMVAMSMRQRRRTKEVRENAERGSNDPGTQGRRENPVGAGVSGEPEAVNRD